jgi:hypothetical protein
MWKALRGLSHGHTHNHPTPSKIKIVDLKEASLAKECKLFPPLGEETRLPPPPNVMVGVGILEP